MSNCYVKVWLLSGAKFDSLDKVIAIIPIGSIERHGDHLPLGTDTIEAEYIAEGVAKKLCAHLYPPIWYGSSKGLARFKGTIDVGDEAFLSYVRAVLKEIALTGYKMIVVINGHGGNSLALRLAAKEVSYSTNTPIVVIDWWKDVAQDLRASLFSGPGHAGEDETSAMLYIMPESVDMSKAKDYKVKEMPKASTYSPYLENLLYPEAVLGEPTKADPNKGRKWLEKVINDICNEILRIANLHGVKLKID